MIAENRTTLMEFFSPIAPFSGCLTNLANNTNLISNNVTIERKALSCLKLLLVDVARLIITPSDAETNNDDNVSKNICLKLGLKLSKYFVANCAEKVGIAE